MKKILFILIILIMPVCLLFAGCGTVSNNYQDNSTVAERFVFVEKIQNSFEDIKGNTYDIYIIVDKQTKIMYWFFKGYRTLSIETILDTDGKPMLWQGEL